MKTITNKEKEVHNAINKEAEKEESVRIFVSGLNPPNLTSKHILQQLKQTFSSNKHKESNVTFTIDKNTTNDKTYIHVTVTLLKKNKQFGCINDLYVKIRKRFHNIIWKGCTIRIEKTKLCFLNHTSTTSSTARTKIIVNSVCANFNIPSYINNIINGQNKDNSKLGLREFFKTHQLPRKITCETNFKITLCKI